MSAEGGEPIRVLCLLHGLGLGGAEHAVYNVVRELSRESCVPVVCTWRRSGPLEAPLRALGIATETPPEAPRWLTRLRTAGRLRRIAKRHRIDVVHAHMSDSAFWGILLQQLAGVPCVITHHSMDLVDGVTRGRRLRSWVLSACARRAAANVAVSTAVAQRLAATAGMDVDDIVLLANSTPLPSPAALESSCAARNRRAASGFSADGAPTIVYAGRMIASKGLDTLIASAPSVLRQFPHATFVLVGGGVLLEGLQQRVQAMGLAAHFRFPGRVLDVAEYLSNADLYASASRLEGLSLALIEAMSQGVPIVASDIAGHRELLGPGECGLLVPPDNPVRLAAAIVDALRDWPATDGRVQRASRLVLERYCSSDLARRHAELYRHLASKRRQ
jgi:glycosyltransferase involved in cell wall biosynthesis